MLGRLADGTPYYAPLGELPCDAAENRVQCHFCRAWYRALAPTHLSPGGARFHIPDAKTEPGVRVVEMSPDLAEAFVEHLDRFRRAGKPTGPDDYVVRNVRGGRISRQRIATIVREAAVLASEIRAQQGLPPLRRTTPHTLRRTYISIALLANRFDVKWVMSQVGHADSKMTLDVYAQLEQRIKRDHGVRFDSIIRAAEEQMQGQGMDPETEHDSAVNRDDD